MSLINPKTVSGAVHIAATDASFAAPTNQLVFGTGINLSVNVNIPAASQTYSIVDVGGNADFVMTGGTQTINGTKNFNIICAQQVNIGTTVPATGYLFYVNGKGKVVDNLQVDGQVLTTNISPSTGTAITLGAATLNVPSGFTLQSTAGQINIIPNNGIVNFGTSELQAYQVRLNRVITDYIFASTGTSVNIGSDFNMTGQTLTATNIKVDNLTTAAATSVAIGAPMVSSADITASSFTAPILQAASGDLTLAINGTGNLVVSGAGYVSAPSYRTPATVAERKFVAYPSANNDYQYLGLGVRAGEFTYNLGGTGDNHVFYCGTSSTTKQELIRIKGTGGIFAPGTLILAGGNAGTGDVSITANGTGNNISLNTTSGTITLGGVITASNGLKFTNATTSYVAGTLNYYESVVSVNITFSGAWISTIGWIFSRLGQTVICRFPDMTGTSTVSDTIKAAAGAIPARFRPAAIFRGLVIGVDAGANQANPVGADIGTDGSIVFYKNAASTKFTSGAICGPFGTTWTWLAA